MLQGFGGANAHAILESYRPAKQTNGILKHDAALPCTPFVFSAVSEKSLIASLESYAEFLRARETVDLRDLAWTLQSRRSALPVKTAFSANTAEGLASKIDAKLAALKNTPGLTIGTRSTPGQPRVLGVFTGQGAQWATMAGHLISSSACVRERIQHLEESLAELPKADRPSWKIGEELLKPADSSRIVEAELSQPLCTAIQIVLVDLLQSAGIVFEAVVGHS
jgi:hybrid polyketide synthase/nonribosomal peptide synthetase ACE1